MSMIEDNQFLLEMQNCFLEEASELIEQTEHCYLELESNPQDIEILNKIFRCAHTAKGGAAAVGFDNLLS